MALLFHLMPSGAARFLQYPEQGTDLEALQPLQQFRLGHPGGQAGHSPAGAPPRASGWISPSALRISSTEASQRTYQREGRISEETIRSSRPGPQALP